ncbi:hypothetical protein EDB80DRAFT_718633 [Ilyonectria destructans]|nr:hypothetical protein EDB80DRAFT_718633 [Ilyonectria destructans]
MTRLSASLVLLSLLSTSPVTALSEYDQEEQNRNADCDNSCFFGSFPGGSCTNDAACMCTQQKYRERYFCCMAEKCAPSVMPDSIQRQSLGCETRNLPFTFDAEAVCGITLTTSSTSTADATSTATSDAKSSVVSASASAASTGSSEASSTGSSDASSTGSETGSGESTNSAQSTPTTTTSSAPVERVVLSSVAILVAVSGILLW